MRIESALSAEGGRCATTQRWTMPSRPLTRWYTGGAKSVAGDAVDESHAAGRRALAEARPPDPQHLQDDGPAGRQRAQLAGRRERCRREQGDPVLLLRVERDLDPDDDALGSRARRP